MNTKLIAGIALGAAVVFAGTYRGGMGQLTDDLTFCAKTGGDICALNAGDLRVGLHPTSRIRAMLAGATQLPFVQADIKDALTRPVAPPVRPVVPPVAPPVVLDAECRSMSPQWQTDAFPCRVTLDDAGQVKTIVGYDPALERQYTWIGSQDQSMQRGAHCLTDDSGVVCATGNF
jgi:hypothetical protein